MLVKLKIDYGAEVIEHPSAKNHYRVKQKTLDLSR